ncbi:DUF397 domain-containing protein [Couchioplanes caeruleus]|uniref:DUF397 domain-containing protein n=1 Tax=Couchioplanes caeruleus TaxID=56438 RepID=UPI0008FF338B|nr:DUF397 domain-containing protein [Couchioplanes caeruleus]
MGDKPSTQAGWRKSSRCGEGNCVEVSTSEFTVRIRDGKDPYGPILEFDPLEWFRFLSAIKAEAFGP